MNTTLSILFYAKKAKATTDGLIPVYLRVTINGQRFEVSTKRYVEESKWSSQAGKVKTNINTEEAKNINSFIDTLRNRVYQLQREIVQESLPFTIENFKNKWLGLTDRPRMILEIFQQHNDQLKALIKHGEFAPGTLDRYKTSLQHTRDFIRYQYNVADLDIRKLDYSFINDYEYWLKTVHKCCQLIRANISFTFSMAYLLIKATLYFLKSGITIMTMKKEFFWMTIQV